MDWIGNKLDWKLTGLEINWTANKLVKYEMIGNDVDWKWIGRGLKMNWLGNKFK